MNAEDIALTIHPHPSLSEVVMDTAELALGMPIQRIILKNTTEDSSFRVLLLQKERRHSLCFKSEQLCKLTLKYLWFSR